MDSPNVRRRDILAHAVAVVLVMCVFTLAVECREQRATRNFDMGLLAFEMSQVSMLAFWTASSHRPLLVRLAVTFVGLGGFAALNEFWVQFTDQGLGMTISFALLWLGLHFSFVATQRVLKRSLICVASEPVSRPRETTQFGIRHLLTWTAFAAMALASTRLFGAELRDLSFMDYVVLPILFATVTGFVEAPAIFGLMSFRKVGAGFVFAAVWIGAFCMLLIVAASLARARAGLPDLSIPFTWYAVSLFSLTLSLGLARGLGWRLDRITQSSA